MHYLRKALIWSVFTLVTLSLLIISPSVSYGQSTKTPPAFQQTFAPTLTARASDRTGIRVKGPAEAAKIVQDYAQSVLGLEVDVRDALGLGAKLSLDLTETLEILLEGWIDFNEIIGTFSAESYIAEFRGGFALLGFGSAVGTGDVAAEISGASFSTFVLIERISERLAAESALTLAKETYPALADLNYRKYDISSGFAWYAEGSVKVTDPLNGKTLTVPQRVLLYVGQGAARSAVAVMVGRGDFADFIPRP